MVRVGEKIKEIRMKKKLSQKALAQEAGIAQSFLSSIERGEKSPTVRTLTKVAWALNIKLEELISSSVNKKGEHPNGKQKK